MTESIPESPFDEGVSDDLVTRMQVIAAQPLSSRAAALTQVYEQLRADLGSAHPSPGER